MGLFKKKKKEEDELEPIDDGSDSEEEEESSSGKEPPVEIQIAKLGAKVEGLVDVRKSFSERFTIISEQIGELRGMILDANKQIQTIEVGSTKTVEMVKEMQPDKFMTILRKQEGQIEGVKASLEGKDAIMKDITKDLTKIRKQMSFYRGIEQVQKLNDEIKKDLFSIKKVQAVVEQHSDKTESMFIDLQKRYGDMDGLTKSVRALEEVLGEAKKKIETQGFNLEKKSKQSDLDDLKKRFDVFASTSKIENLKEFGNQLDEMMNAAKDSLRDIQASNEKVEELRQVIDQTNLPQLAMNVRKIDKLSALLEVDVGRNKELVSSMSKDHEQLSNIHQLVEDNANTKKTIVSLEQAIGGLINKLVLLSQEKATLSAVNSIDKEQKSQYENSRKLLQDIDSLRKALDVLEKDKINPSKVKILEESENNKEEAIKELIVHQDEVHTKIEDLENQIKDLKKVVSLNSKRSTAITPRHVTKTTRSTGFRLADGTIISSLDDLTIKLKNMSNGVFSSHVTNTKNDFADWIQSGLRESALANVIRTKRTRRDILKVISVYSRMVV